MMQANYKTVIPSGAGRFFLLLRSCEASARGVEESLFDFSKEKW
jgi:hypothetical protein